MAEHKGLAAGRWKTLTYAERLGNIGSEVERAIRAYEVGRAERFEPAFRRALELFDLTTADDRWHGPGHQEVARARGEFVRLFEPEPPAGCVERIIDYFLRYAVVARKDIDFRRSMDVYDASGTRFVISRTNRPGILPLRYS